MIKAIIFDLDGTLLDTLEDLTDSTNYALALHGYPPRTVEEVRGFVGNGIPKLIERATPPGGDWEAVLRDFTPHYQAHCQDKTRPYAGVDELLNEVKARGYKSAIVTNKADAAAQTLCKRWFPQVDLVVGDRPGLRRKPEGDMVWAALDALGASKEESVYMGDSQVDAATARNSGLPLIAVTWGFRDRETLLACGAANLIDTPDRFWEALDKI